ncbi:MAG: transcription antitermination factor NusB [Firmicutes bacterium]|nr:transcription antitermination factor NusB [Bacillota bacterium]MDD4263597.1 transcription antitermination factor NusB [Bacillota bacterium]MDD4693908.1 transcription antitermination factor NusB [Bacillota bacterium]
MDDGANKYTKRERAVELLYQTELTGKDLDEVFTYADPLVEEPERKLVEEVWQRREDLDNLIEKTSREWKLERIGYVERNILRLALYEMKYSETPVAYAINAAVELAKKYSGEEAGRFVNGVLGRAFREKDE